jgi:hypothetical protein
MMSRASHIQPPRIAVWLVDLFTPDERAESIQGDLLEEFSHLASKSGVPFARRWYWRQTVKTVSQLMVVGFRTAPWSTTAAIAGGFLLRRFISGLPERAIFAVLHRYQVYEHHFNTYRFFASSGIDIGHVIVFMFVGCMVALAAKGREMVSTMALGLVFSAMAVFGSLVMVTRTGDYAFLWRLTWYFADSFAIVIGGAIVRTRRSAATTLPSDA